MNATFKKSVSGFADGRLYAVSPPVTFGDDQSAAFVVVSKVNSGWAHETYIFPADKKGEVVDWMELEGSRKGEVSHEDVLRFAGYEVESESA